MHYINNKFTIWHRLSEITIVNRVTQLNIITSLEAFHRMLIMECFIL